MTTSASSPLATTVRPGALTALLADLVRAPEGAGWEVPLLPGDVVGRFEVVREIGRGGFGVVYEALDSELGRSIALKALRPPRRDGRPDGVDARLAEAEAAARLAHPNIVHLYDVGRCERGAYLILELLRGRPLSEWSRRAVPVRDAVRVAAEVARGLAHAHASGVVHRDLKPANVFVCDDGQVKVLDFGLAHVFGREAVRGGTPAYMAPEQARGETGDERSDLYGLGVILHELLTGRLPAATAAPSSAEPRRSSRRGRVPGALWRLVDRLLSTDPAQRPASAVQVHAQLATVQRTLQPRRLLWATTTVAVLAVGAAVALGLRARPLPPGRLLVAMADTVNGTGDPDLDALSPLLATALEQSRRVSILARSRLVAAVRDGHQRLPESIDEGLLRRIAPAVHAQVAVVPVVTRAGEGFDLALRGIDLAHGEPLFTVRQRAAGKGAIPDALDRLSEQVRGALHEPPTDAPRDRVPVAQVASAHPAAWSAYTEARRLDADARPVAALAALERAVAIDPEFALAHAALAERSSFFDDAGAERHFASAMRHLDRLPPKERLLLEAAAAVREHRYAEALATWDRVIALWPQDPRAFVAAGTFLLHRYGDSAAARPYLEQALAIAGVDRIRAVDFLIDLGRLDEALAFARRWTEEDASALAFANLSGVHRVRGEPGPALQAARRVLSYQGPSRSIPCGGGTLWSYVEADALDEFDREMRRAGRRCFEVAALRGSLREALTLLDANARATDATVGSFPLGQAPATAREAVYRHARVHLLWGFGDADRLWREVEEQLRLGSSSAMCSAGLLASVGDLDRAARLMALWNGLGDPRLPCRRLYRAVTAWKRGDLEGAARTLTGMYGAGAAYWLGVVLAELGHDRDAIAAFHRFQRDPTWNFAPENVIAYPRSLYLEALSLERLGERDAARARIARLLSLWRRADPDLPYLREARALSARLTR